MVCSCREKRENKRHCPNAWPPNPAGDPATCCASTSLHSTASILGAAATALRASRAMASVSAPPFFIDPMDGCATFFRCRQLQRLHAACIHCQLTGARYRPPLTQQQATHMCDAHVAPVPVPSAGFTEDVRRSAADPEFIQAQLDIHDVLYWDKMMAAAAANGLRWVGRRARSPCPLG